MISHKTHTFNCYCVTAQHLNFFSKKSHIT